LNVTKIYQSNPVNFHLLPDLMDAFKSRFPESNLIDSKQDYELGLIESFEIVTSTQRIIAYENSEFRDTLRILDEPIISLDARIKCVYLVKHLKGVECGGAPFIFEYRPNQIMVILGRNTLQNINKSFSAIEETLSLKIDKQPQIRSDMVPRKRTAFVAHAFDQTGRSYAYELVKFLNLLGFQVSTGEGFSPIGISKKVKERLASQEIVIIIISQKENSTWLIQEAAGASFIGKPLFILLAEGTEYKAGIHGDLEFIEFPAGTISTSFTSLLEGFNELGYKFR